MAWSGGVWLEVLRGPERHGSGMTEKGFIRAYCTCQASPTLEGLQLGPPPVPSVRPGKFRWLPRSVQSTSFPLQTGREAGRQRGITLLPISKR
jgi:hypothetical protein